MFVLHYFHYLSCFYLFISMGLIILFLERRCLFYNIFHPRVYLADLSLQYLYKDTNLNDTNTSSNSSFSNMPSNDFISSKSDKSGNFKIDLNIGTNLANDLLHDISSTFCNIYFSFEMMVKKNDSLGEILNNSLLLFRRQIEFYKSIFSGTYENIIKCASNYLDMIGVKTEWIGFESVESKIINEKEIVGFIILFLTKRFLKDCKLTIVKETDEDEFIIKIIVSKFIIFREKDIKKLSGIDVDSNCSFLEIAYKLLKYDAKRINISQDDETTIIMIY
jgi:hypothetical protein